jgi:hypothetical protein
LLSLNDEKTADRYFDFFRSACVHASDKIIKESMRFRLKQESESNPISYVDCIRDSQIKTTYLPLIF